MEDEASLRTGFKVMFGVEVRAQCFSADKCHTAGSDLCEGMVRFSFISCDPPLQPTTISTTLRYECCLSLQKHHHLIRIIVDRCSINRSKERGPKFCMNLNLNLKNYVLRNERQMFTTSSVARLHSVEL
jgi:hypothetical protein